jgi:hypothetical protein
MYPIELDPLYGDAILLKVSKKLVEDDKVCEAFEIIDILTDPLMLDNFFHYYMPNYGAFDCVASRQSPLQISSGYSSSIPETFYQDSVKHSAELEVESIGKMVTYCVTKSSFKRKRDGQTSPNSSDIVDATMIAKCPNTI